MNVLKPIYNRRASIDLTNLITEVRLSESGFWFSFRNFSYPLQFYRILQSPDGTKEYMVDHFYYRELWGRNRQ